MQTFKQTILYTAPSGEALFREELLVLDQGKPQAWLTPLMESSGYQLRHSPVGFESEFHCTTTPQWVFILSGQMEILLHNADSRVFKPGEHFYSADTPPVGVVFDPLRHGHRSRQVGPDPLVTLFLRAQPSWG
jgi:oxalate decarboxylase/phosphoglucose isomerase-like protein (cupin superfamily)